jgi:small nuclear ribonucleoprotein F
MSFEPINPKPFLFDLAGQEVVVRLKWGGLELKGILKSVDDFMNLLLINTEEWNDTTFRGALGEVLVRCNNVLYVKAANAVTSS